MHKSPSKSWTDYEMMVPWVLVYKAPLLNFIVKWPHGCWGFFFLLLFFISSCQVKASILHVVTMELKTYCNHATENLRVQTHTNVFEGVTMVSFSWQLQREYLGYFQFVWKTFFRFLTLLYEILSVSLRREAPASIVPLTCCPFASLDGQPDWHSSLQKTMNSSKTQQQTTVLSSDFVVFYLFFN